MSFNNVLPPIVHFELGGKKTYLQYNTFLSDWYLSEVGINPTDMEDSSLTDVLHIIRAGLIQANYAENKAIIDSGKILEVVPSFSELTELITMEKIGELQTLILEALIQSLPKLPIGEEPSGNKKKQTG